MLRLTRAQAEAFYEVHRGRPFYDELVAFMSSGPCFPMVLEREDAVAAFRASIGATDPAEAAPGTIRKGYHWQISRSERSSTAPSPASLPTARS